MARLPLIIVTFARVWLLVVVLPSARAATWYVDGGATGANNGTSWANAWNSPGSVSGVSGGDTVYISGGPPGSTRNYPMSTWSLPQGTSGGSITYQIGQDSAHNGTAIFNGGGTDSPWLNGTLSYTTILGDAGDGAQHFAVTNFAGSSMYITAFTNLRVAYVKFDEEADLSHFPNPTGANTLEIDHCYYYKVPDSDPRSDEEWAMVMNYSGGQAFDVIKIHDNTVYCPQPAMGKTRAAMAMTAWTSAAAATVFTTIR